MKAGFFLQKGKHPPSSRAEQRRKSRKYQNIRKSREQSGMFEGMKEQ